MDIAALAISMKQEDLMQNVSLAVTKQSMEIQEQSIEQLIKVTNVSHRNLGHTIDISI